MMIEETFSKDMQLFKKFIRHHWISRGQYSNESTLYSNFEAKFIADNKIDEVIVYLDDLVLASELYLNFRYANVDDISGLTGARFDKREVKDTLEFLSFLNVDQVYSVLLFVFKNNPKDFKKHLIKLSAFQFLFKHVPGSPSKVESIFASYCEGKIKTDKLYSDLLVICSGQKVAFSESVSEKLKYKSGRSGDVQFILEKYLYSKGPGESFSKPTIEHIIAQKPEKKEMDVLLPQFGNDKKIFNAYKHKLGNLTILEKSSNSSADFSNKSFSEKKELYNQTNFTVNTEVLNYKFENHPMKAIDERTEDLAEGIFDIFIDALKTGKWPNSKNED